MLAAVITVYDELGQAILVPRSQWIDEILPNSLAADWNEPARLAEHVEVAIDDGLAPYVLAAAQHLVALDADCELHQRLLARALGQTGRGAQAVDTLERYAQGHGASPELLRDLAALVAEQGDRRQAQSLCDAARPPAPKRES